MEDGRLVNRLRVSYSKTIKRSRPLDSCVRMYAERWRGKRLGPSRDEIRCGGTIESEGGTLETDCVCSDTKASLLRPERIKEKKNAD